MKCGIKPNIKPNYLLTYGQHWSDGTHEGEHYFNAQDDRMARVIATQFINRYRERRRKAIEEGVEGAYERAIIIPVRLERIRYVVERKTCIPWKASEEDLEKFGHIWQ